MLKKLPLSILAALALGVAVVTFHATESRSADAAKPVPFDWDYEFARPVKPTEMTYTKYRAKHAEEAKKMGLDPAKVADGMDTWHWWVGVDNPGFWEDLATLTQGPHNYTNLRLDLLRVIMVTPRNERFKRLGLINDPDTVASEKPDQFGLTIDRMKDGTLTWDPTVFGYSSGIIGLQLFKNPKFDPKKWDPKKYIDGGNDGYMQPPYQVGMACAFCHISFDPQHPPANPEDPKWENLTSSLGNNYLREGLAFGQGQKDNSMVYHYLATQEPGTSETSRFPYDFINNPTNINAILRLRERLQETHVEKITPLQADMIRKMYANAGLKDDDITGALGGTKENPTIKVPHVLTDGADSLGVLMASTRVYVNEGMQHADWYQSLPVDIFNLKRSLLNGFKPKEFDIEGKERQGNSPWIQTERRMPNMATFLMSYDSFPLAKAENGKKYLTEDQIVLNEGKRVFADNCASCHSSKKPDPLPTDPAKAKEAWRALVMKSDFLEHNYLSDDDRHSVQEIGTNMQRAQGSNAMQGWTWGQMSSQTYKDQRAPIVEYFDVDPATGAKRPLYNPLTGKYDVHFKGHQSFYRTPTLVSIWATAPFFHNNALGKYTNDPSVAGRMEAFDDAAEKLLWPEKRLGVKSVKVANETTSLPSIFPGLRPWLREKFNDMKLELLEFPPGTPVNLLMSFNPKYTPELLGAYVKGVLGGKPRRQFKSLVDSRREAGIESIEKKLLELNTCPDFVEDRGHYFGTQLSDKEKHALIEYMKWM